MRFKSYVHILPKRPILNLSPATLLAGNFRAAIVTAIQFQFNSNPIAIQARSNCYQTAIDFLWHPIQVRAGKKIRLQRNRILPAVSIIITLIFQPQLIAVVWSNHCYTWLTVIEQLYYWEGSHFGHMVLILFNISLRTEFGKSTWKLDPLDGLHLVISLKSFRFFSLSKQVHSYILQITKNTLRQTHSDWSYCFQSNHKLNQTARTFLTGPLPWLPR